MTSDTEPPQVPEFSASEPTPPATLAAYAADMQGTPLAGFEPAQLLESLHVLYLIADRDLIVRALHGNMQLAPHAVVGMRLVDADPELRAFTNELNALLQGNARRLDMGVVWRAGAEVGRFVLAQSAALRNAGGEIIGVSHALAEADKLGERWQQMERRLRELAALRRQVDQLNMDVALAQTELQRLDEAKTQFVSAAAHELRNPLASLIGFLELLESEDNGNFTAQQRDYLRGIDRGAARLRLLTNNLLDLSRLDSNRLELMMMRMDPLALVEQAVDEIQPLLEAKQQRLSLKAEPGLPQIWCDRQRAMQILTNLLSNAHKYSPTGGAISVQTSRLKDKPMVCLRVKDTGIGIADEDQPHIFNRFFRAGNGGMYNASGAGLGLPISQSLARLHGGKLWFESKLGKGTSFFVTFPIAD